MCTLEKLLQTSISAYAHMQLYYLEQWIDAI
jgi:hypothetical protein